MRPRRTVALSPLALTVSLIALASTVGSTAYAAGLAANSVGTAQLKAGAVSTAKLRADAVTGAKIKPGAVTGADIKARSVGAGDLVPGTLPARSVTLNRDLAFGAPVTLLTSRGVRWVADCDEPTQSIALEAQDTDSKGPALEASGTSVFRNNGDDVATTAVNEVVDGFTIKADPTFDSNPAASFDGILRSGPNAPARVLAVVSMAPTLKPCQVRLFITPAA